MKKEFDIGKFYYQFILISITVSFLILLEKRSYSGDLIGKIVNVSNNDIIYIYIFHIAIYSLFYYYTNLITSFKLKKILYNENFMNKLVLVILLFNIYISYKYGVGRSVGGVGFKFRFLTNLFPIDIFFMFEYCLGNREKKINKINFILYVLYKIYLGWSSFVLYIFLLEAYRLILKRNWLKYFLYLSIFFLPIVYKILYTIKFYVRTKSIIELNFSESILKLASRLNNLNMVIYIYQKLDKVKEIVSQIGELNYLSNSLYYLIPKSIIGISYDSSNNLNKQLVIKLIDESDQFTSVEPSYIGTIISYLNTLPIYLFYTVFLILIIGLLSSFFKNKYLKMYIIIYILNFIRSGSISELVYMAYSLILLIFVSLITTHKKGAK